MSEADTNIATAATPDDTRVVRIAGIRETVFGAR